MSVEPALFECRVNKKKDRNMKTIAKLVIALSLMSFVPAVASADWADTSQGSQQRWTY
jgi:hypothetical protein